VPEKVPIKHYSERFTALSSSLTFIWLAPGSASSRQLARIFVRDASAGTPL